jgi:hypothetical protein
MELLTATLQGHKRPDFLGAEAKVFIHTQSCIYALDEEGICRYVIGIDGSEVQGFDRCRGAQYVASLDPRTGQLLVADPRPGAHALFVARSTGWRAALLKTPAITRIVHALEEGVNESSVSAKKLGWVEKGAEKAWLRATMLGGTQGTVRRMEQAGAKPLLPPRRPGKLPPPRSIPRPRPSASRNKPS